MTPSVHSKIIKELAARTGFQHCGLSPATPLTDEEKHYRTWLDQQHWGVMDYLHRNFAKRLDPRLVMPEARTVIALLTTYNSAVEIPSDDNLLIARYARGKDYHVRVKAMMNKLVSRMEHEFGPVKCHSFVDSGLVMEKAWAQRSGVGWRGKNTLLINRHHGSWFFIGILLTDLETEHDTPEKDHCGNCDRCMRACPTGALEAPHVLNPLKCISYHTIETNDALPEDLRGRFGNRMFGCDICQEACPFNGKPMVSNDPGCLPDPRLVEMRKKDWVNLGRDEFGSIFKDTPVIRTGYDTLMRNIRFVTEK